MPQETNLNVAPYFDDFDSQQNYYKVLYKPGFPVQARELTGMQSILQNQVEEMGNHFFKEGAKVIPGDLTYVQNFYCIQIQSEFLGVPVGIYLDQIVGATITGQTSGVTAKVVKVLSNDDSERGVYTLYINYENTGSSSEEISEFLSNEILISNKNITYATTFISAGEGFCTTITQNASAVGSAMFIADGVYFLRGYMVNVPAQTLILDQYNNTPSYRIGLDVVEEIVSSDIDQSLNDNAQGFNNFTAPGADRLRITATLSKKGLNSFNESNFVQLSTIENGNLRTIITGTEYNFLGDELASRTFDESGHYYIKEYVATVKESLNNNQGNRGLFLKNQVTTQGNVPAPDLGVYKVSPGKAYVKGYEVENISPSLIDFQKPRTTKVLKDQGINFGFGPTLAVNRVFGSPTIGINTSNSVSLRDTRMSATQDQASGEEIGVARIYDFALEGGSYDALVPDLNKWDLSLYDVQTFTNITVNEPVTLSNSVYIKGESSGATGFLRSNVSAGTAITAYQVNGDFFKGERLLFNGLVDDARYVTNSINYSLSDVRSIYSKVGVTTFTADTVQVGGFNFGNASVTGQNASNQSFITVSADPNFSFVGLVTTNNLIQYSRPDFDIVSYAKVVGVSRTNFTIEAVTSTANVNSGALPTSTEQVGSVQIIGASGVGNAGSGNITDNESIYSAFPKKNINSVNLLGSDLVIRRQYNVSITNGSTTPIDSEENEIFLAFDEERYTLIRSDGTTEVLTPDKFVYLNGSTTLQIRGLGVNAVNCKLITTIRKSEIKSKVKLKATAKSIVVDKSNSVGSGIGTTTLNDGLVYGDYPFGTRVQDEIISLNTPDVVTILGVYESQNTDNADSPHMTTSQMDGITNTTNDLIIGEIVIGSQSGAKAMFVGKKTDTSIFFVYLNKTTFKNTEVVNFESSSVNAIAGAVSLGSKNITKDFRFNNGQKGGFYDYARIVRKGTAGKPARKLKIFFTSAYYENSDQGDITTANSYTNFNYTTEIGSVNGRRNTDIIDARPRVNDYSVAQGSRSPLEFYGRDFLDANGGTSQSSKHIIASDESMTLEYDYFLPRADRLYLTKDSGIQLVSGTPDDQPRLPDGINGALNIANIFLPAYLYKTSDAKINFVEHKRFQMSDISKLEQRIKNLEYYTSLSALENNTLNSFVEDANGLNRFKSGVFVDNFSSLEPQDTSIGVRNAIDTRNGVLRPSHYTTSVNLQLGTTAVTGIGTVSDANQDSDFAEVVGINVRKTGRVLTLNYQDEAWLTQPYATRIESVTPFLIQFWQGEVEMTPDVDVWIDVNRVEVNNVMMEGSFQGISEALGAEVSTTEDGVRLGVSPVIWNSWETVGVNVDMSMSNQQQFIQGGSDVISNGLLDNLFQGAEVGINQIVDASDTVVNNINATGGVTLDQQRTGSQFTVNEVINTESLGDRIVRRDLIHFMRSRNISFKGTRLKPFTRVYSFFDDVDVTAFSVPKLIEIEMVHGTFIPGENCSGVVDDGGSAIISSASVPSINFRIANANHKYGPYNNPSDVYDSNPYNRNNTIASVYSESSSILNIDTFSLASQDFPQYDGFIGNGMVLTGSISGAQAKVKSVRLKSDRVGTVLGSFKVPDGGNPANPVFETGRSRFRLTSSPINNLTSGATTTAAEATFYSQGDVDTTQQTTLSVRNATVEQTDISQVRALSDVAISNNIAVESGFDVVTNIDQDVTNITNEFITNEITEITNITNEITEVTNVTNEITNVTNVFNTTNVTQVVRPPRPPAPPDPDPLAQTFFVDDQSGVFVTKVDLFFQAKDSNIPFLFEIREVSLGTPTTTALPFSKVSVDPDQISLSDDGTVATTVTLQSPVYLNGLTEYALVLLSHSTEYKVWTSRFGEADVRSSSRESGQILVTEQPLLGSLFKSQNASVWTPSQYEDLKFNMYVASFASSGNCTFYNPNLPEDVAKIEPTGITMLPRQARIGIGTTVNDPDIQLGNRITQRNNDVSGVLVGYAGSATAQMTITNAGVGYTPSAAGQHFSYAGVALTSVTGFGLNATADITVVDGVAIGATINVGGVGYALGDVLTPISVGTLELGSGMQLSVSTILGQNTLIVDNVQGNYLPSSSNRMEFINGAGITTELNYDAGGDVIALNPINVTSQGDYMKIFQRNHGLYSNVDRVQIKGVSSDVIPSTLATPYDFDATTFLTLEGTGEYAQFEGVGVAGTNPGYIRINEEIISYTGVNGRTLTGITRGIDNTIVASHSKGETAEKYELNGVSLRRINRPHLLSNVTANELSEAPIGVDYYYLNVRMNAQGANRAPGNVAGFAPLYFNERAVGGGPNAQANYNLPFSLCNPKITNVTPFGTNIIPQVRTISASSVSGNQESYNDEGFQQVTLFDKNYFSSLRQVASPQNESQILASQTFPGNKSFSMNMDLTTQNRRLSPVIDLDSCSVVFTSNRINAPITDYANDFRVNGLEDDPNRFVYVSKNVVLENPATSLQVVLDAYVSTYGDVRVFYALNQDTKPNETIFIPFPGHRNIAPNGSIIDLSSNNGTSDVKVPKIDSYQPEPSVNLFKEYKFTIDELVPFKSFRIKIIGTSTDQSNPVLLRNLRGIALA